MGMLLIVLYRIPAMVIAVTAHEAVKAAASWRLGDSNPKLTGRLTLNPVKHIDPLGALLIVLFGYGWGKPVETSPMFYRDRRKATLVVYILPSVVNLVLGMMFGFAAYLMGLGLEEGASSAAAVVAHDVVFQVAAVNVAMALFNIIPIYPLDGSRVLALFMRAEARVRMANSERWLQLFLMVCIIFGVVSMVFDPLVGMIVVSV